MNDTESSDTCTSDTERLSVLTVALYTAWNIGLGAALLRIRIDYAVGELFTLLGMFVGFTAFSVAIWFKVWLPWNSRVLHADTDRTESQE